MHAVSFNEVRAYFASRARRQSGLGTQLHIIERYNGNMRGNEPEWYSCQAWTHEQAAVHWTQWSAQITGMEQEPDRLIKAEVQTKVYTSWVPQCTR